MELIQLVNEIVDRINRPNLFDAVYQVTKLTILEAHQSYPFKRGERYFDIEVTANNVFSGASLDNENVIHAVSVVDSIGSHDFGTPIAIKEYSDILARVLKARRNHVSNLCDYELFESSSYGDYVRDVHKYIAVTHGANIGLFPTPTSNVVLRLFVNSAPSYDDLVDDYRSFMTDLYSDYIIFRTLEKVNHDYLRLDNRAAGDKILADAAWERIKQHDSRFQNFKSV